MRFGFAVKVLGEGGLPDCDGRRWQNSPHLRTSIAYLDAILDYLNRSDLRMYRMSSDFVPYATHPDLPQFHRQIEECADELAAVGAKAREYDMRLSLHPSQYIVLNARDESVAHKSILDLNAQADLLDAMEMGPECVVVTHVGGAYGDKGAGIERFAARYQTLPEATRRRLVVENDDTTFSAADALRVHDLCGIRVVFDILHHFCCNPERTAVRDMLERAVSTWHVGVRPKIHYSTPRTEAQAAPRKNGKAAAMEGYTRAPDMRLHADYINPFEFLYFMEVAQGLEFDVMFESKAKDLSVLKLRQDLARYAGARGEPLRGDYRRPDLVPQPARRAARGQEKQAAGTNIAAG